MQTGRELFVHELKDMYDAENKLLNALDNMADKVSDPKLTEGFEQHREQTQGQVKRLERVFELVGERPQRETCDGINGLIKEFGSFVNSEDPSDEVLNVFATSAALKVEHYELASYKSLIKLAHQAGLREVVELLEQTLNEELETARELENMAIQLGEKLALTP